MSRAVVEGLFGVHPDALAGTLTVSPGFPKDWTHARLTHPDVGVDFVRKGRVDTWEITQTGDRFKTLTLRVPAAFTNVASLQVSGQDAKWVSDPEAAGRPVLEVVTKAGERTQVRITWAGEEVDAQTIAGATPGKVEAGFTQMSSGAFQWWAQTLKPQKPEVVAAKPVDWQALRPGGALESVDLTRWFNDRVSAIFAMGKYLSPRSHGVSLELPWQGAGAWAGHLTTLPVIDDSGVRRVAAEDGGKLTMPNGVFFSTPSAPEASNVIFTSQWDNYPRDVTVAVSGRASHAYLLMAGSTNFMQSRMDNGEVVVRYTDGSSARLALHIPETWWPIQQD